MLSSIEIISEMGNVRPRILASVTLVDYHLYQLYSKKKNPNF